MIRALRAALGLGLLQISGGMNRAFQPGGLGKAIEIWLYEVEISVKRVLLQR